MIPVYQVRAGVTALFLGLFTVYYRGTAIPICTLLGYPYTQP